MVRPLTISELEQESGVPRSTIYYYVREGLLPPAQKAAASRAIYSDVYVALLGEIARLQAARGRARGGQSADPAAPRASPGSRTRPGGPAQRTDARRHPRGGREALRAQGVQAHPRRRRHQGRGHHAFGLLHAVRDEAAALPGIVRRLRALDGSADRAATGRRARSGRPPADARQRLLRAAGPEP